MMLKEQLVKTNKALKSEGLVIDTWGNASIRIDDKMYIKPSGVPFEELEVNQLSLVSLANGQHIEGNKPSVDSPTHYILYKNFKHINAIIHTHSKYCTIFAQAHMSIPCLGTTHADYFYGDIPIVNELDTKDIVNDYEYNTGLKIVEHFNKNNICPLNMQAALLPSHGVFIWGTNLTSALQNAIVLEYVAELAYKTLPFHRHRLNPNLLDKHFLRKHGDKKYYGQ